jgi:Ion channel
VLNIACVIVGFGLLAVVLWEAFETIVLPRRVTRQFRLTRLFYRTTWLPWRFIARRIHKKKAREAMYSYYGPLSLLLLMAFWAAGMVIGFALIDFGDGERFNGALLPGRLGNALYISGTTFFTLGLGDITPAGPLGRFVTVFEAGLGFGFLALVIGYFPVLYQSFSRRETTITLLDARAGSPPTAFELLRRHSSTGTLQLDALTDVLHTWENLAADMMESHLSYPVLAYFRSQHDNQSWIGALTAVLDVCALSMVGLEGMCQYQARMTFAIARHTVVDLSQVFGARPQIEQATNRLSDDDLLFIRKELAGSGFILTLGDDADAELKRLRAQYEPYAMALAGYLGFVLPPWVKRDSRGKDNWQTTAWQQQNGITPHTTSVHDEHF